MLKLLRKYHCPWGSSVIKYAVGYGQHKTFSWLYKEGCPYNKKDLLNTSMASTYLMTALVKEIPDT